MFTGLVAELGTVQKLAQQGESYHLTVAAVKVLQTKIVEDKNRTKYQLREGDVYKLVESRMDKANTPCVIEVQTVNGATAKLEVDKTLLQPVDEGTWLQVRSKGGAGAWVRVQSKWY